MNFVIKILGIILCIAGFLLTLKPDLLGKYPPSVDAYRMIEKRVRWGLLIGLGLFLIFYSNRNSWGLNITTLFLALTFGIIISRLTGFVKDGFFVQQLWWLIMEIVALLFFSFLYWKQK